MSSIRDGFGQGLYGLVKNHKNVMVLSADLAESTRVAAIARDFPDQFIECGVAEQNMMGIAAGLASEGFVPFVNSFAVFSPGRNWDQLRISVCYSNLSVKIVGHHCGFSDAGDGATHQAFEDIAITRCLPNLSIMQPGNFSQAVSCVLPIYQHNGPVYVRIGKYESSCDSNLGEINYGKANILKEGEKLTLISSGYFINVCLEIAQKIEGVELINITTIKPIDKETIFKSVQKTGRVVVVEDHQIDGGLGSVISEILGSKIPTPILRLGMCDEFGLSGDIEELIRYYNLDSANLIKNINKWLL